MSAIPASVVDNWSRKVERQQAPTLSEIHPGHLARYLFAAMIVSGTVLDAACGCGYGSKIMQKAGALVTGVDLEDSAIAYAEEHYPGPDYIKGNVMQPHGAFDWVVSLETLEHLPEPKKALDAFRMSRNLIISTPNEKHFPFRKGDYADDHFPHIRHYTPDELEELLNASGWLVISRYCQPAKRAPVFTGTKGVFLIYVCQ